MLAVLAVLCAIPAGHPESAVAAAAHADPRGSGSAAHPAEDEHRASCDMTTTPCVPVAMTASAATGALPPEPAALPLGVIPAPMPPARPPLFLINAALLI